MEIDNLSTLNEKWIGRISKFYLIFIPILFLGEFSVYFLYKNLNIPLYFNDKTYVFIYLILTISICSILLVVNYYICKSNVKSSVKNVSLLVSSELIALVTTVIHFRFPTGILAFSIPPIVALVFGKKRYVSFAFGLSIVFLFINYTIQTLVLNHNADPNALFRDYLIFLLDLGFQYILEIFVINYSQSKNRIIELDEKKKMELESKMKRDSMTDLLNHTEFFYELSDKKFNANKTKQPLTLAVFDMDFFKRINDTYGHHCGDIVILFTANLLKKCFGEIGIVFRYGGEEFAVLFENSTIRQVFPKVEEFRKLLNQKEFTFMHKKRVTVSCGLYEYDGDDVPSSMIFDRADFALYQAKKTGRNKVVLWTEKLGEYANT